MPRGCGHDACTVRSANCAPNFEDYYDRPLHSDLAISICEVRDSDGDSDAAKLSSTARDELYGHVMVLVGNSGVWKAQLDNWPETNHSDRATDSRCQLEGGSSSKRRVDFTVPVGQLELGRQLLKGIYQKAPDYSHLRSEQLLQLMQLADKYDVPKVVVAAASSLKAVPTSDWPWEAVTAVLCLPESLKLQQCIADVIQQAESALVARLGDLEGVWGDDQLQETLLGLPPAALLQLLQHDGTSVASEHTIVYTIIQWYEHQAADAVTSEQLLELLQCIRMQHCSPPYILTHMMQNPVVRKCFSAEQLSIGGLLSSSPAMFKGVKHPVLQQYPAWSAVKQEGARRSKKEQEGASHCVAAAHV